MAALAQPVSAGPASHTPRAVTPVLSARRVVGAVARERAQVVLAASITKILDDAANAPWLRRSCTLVAVNGQVLVAKNPDQAVTPASTMKTMTAIAALKHLDHKATLRTEVRGNQQGDTLTGPLFLVGGGDPVLETEPYANGIRFKGHQRTKLEDLADQVVKAGIRTVPSVVGDEARWDDKRTNPGWKPHFSGTEVSPLGALMVNDGGTSVAVAGKPPVRPPAGGPAVHAAAVFTELLKARGVNVGGAPGVGKAQGKTIGSVQSPPTHALVTQMMLESDNTIAEALLKELDVFLHKRQGTTAGGAQIVRETLETAKVDVKALVQDDGSGLSLNDKTSCAMLHSAVSQAGRASPLAEGLPVAGESGTLTNRMKNTSAVGRLRAKTGFLNGISSLVGWVDPKRPDWPPVSFAVVSNDVPLNQTATALADKIGVAMAAWPESFDPSGLGPKPPS